MTSTNDVSLRMARTRSRQAEAYSGFQGRSHAGQQARSLGVTLASLEWEYGKQPIRYLSGRLYVGDEVVRVRKGTELFTQGVE